MNFCNKIVNWVRNNIKLVRPVKFKIENVSEFPSLVKDRFIFIVKEGNNADTLVFKCPCGCKADIYLNLLKDTRPNWDFSISKKGKISITPSVLRTVGCKSHFLIHQGKVLWVTPNF